MNIIIGLPSFRQTLPTILYLPLLSYNSETTVIMPQLEGFNDPRGNDLSL